MSILKDSPVVLDCLSQYQKIPTITGPLLKIRNVNGEAGKDDITGRQSLYGKMAVLDLKHWRGVYRLTRCDLAFEYRVNFNQLTDYKPMYQPIFLMPNGNMNNQLYYRYCEKEFSLKYKPVQFNSTNNNTVNKHAYYSTLPKYFLMCTNISYTEANIQRIQAYMRNTEVYDGISSDDNTDDDVTNWRSHWNIGISQQSQFKNENRCLYYCAQGNYNITSEPGPPDEQVYEYSFPYYPFDLVDKMATSRSDIPDVEYAQMWSNAGPNINNDLYVVTEMVDDSPIHRFKDNKNKDASIAFFSEYQSDWMQNVKYDGYDLDGFSFGDNDSLSQKYNVMVVPVNMKGSKASNYSIDLVNTFWIGACQDVDPSIKALFPVPDTDFMYKLTSGHDDPHRFKGGLSMYQYFNNTWNVIDECYIHSFVNPNLAIGRDPVAGLTYDGKYTVDLTTQHNVFVVYCGNTRRQVFVFPDVDDLSKAKVYFCDGYDQKYDNTNYNKFEPLGADPINNNGYKEVWITNLWVGSSNPSNLYYMPVVGGVNNNLPVKHVISTNPIEQVCGFMLYNDSATQNRTGGWDINPNFVIPILHQGQFCVSASFMDARNEDLWLTNDERYDTINTEPSNQNSYEIDSSLVNNYPQVGTNNPTFQFDNNLSRCGFSNLHTAKRMSILDMPYDNTTGDYAKDDSMGALVVKIQDNVVKNVYLFFTLYAFAIKTINSFDFQSYNNSGNNFNTGLNYSISGLSFHSLYGESIDDNNQDVSDMTLYTTDNWDGCLLNKLGFAYEDLFSKFGLPDNIYDSSISVSESIAIENKSID
jgi:hypothetical protein